MKKQTIKSKIIRMQMMLAAPIIVMVTGASLANDFILFKTSIEKQFASTSKILERNLVPALAFLDKPEAKEVLSSLSTEPSIISARLYDINGELFASFINKQRSTPFIDSSHQCLGSGRISDHYVYYYPIQGENGGSLCLEVDLKVFLGEYYRYLLIVIAVFIASLFLAYLLAVWLQRALSNPIMELAETTKNISNSGDYSLRMDVGNNENPVEEIETFSVEFNRMLDQIQARDEKILQEKVAAENANRSKSVFLANISHELRTPMHGILSFARFGQQKIETASKEKIKSYFDEINDSGSRLMNLLNDLLDLSKLEAGKVIYSMKRDNFSDIARAANSELQAFAEEKGVKLETVILSTDAFAMFDSEKMMQVLRNVLSNAIKFSESGTTIKTIVDTTKTHIRCSIINRGIGIPQAELGSIFDKFTQSSKTRTGAGGTGLGLAICKETIKQHAGDIWAESELNNETKFTIELPKAPSA